MKQMHPFISLKWDQAALSPSRPALVIEGAETEELRVKGVGYEYRLPDPTSRKELEYYRDKANNGYLAHTVPQGGNPSLFFKSTSEVKTMKREKRERRAREGLDGAVEGGKESGKGEKEEVALNSEANKLW